jgi:hypothetical protein
VPFCGHALRDSVSRVTMLQAQRQVSKLESQTPLEDAT